MDSNDFIVDIHTHPTLRAYNTHFGDQPRNIWDKSHNETFDTKISRWARLKSKEILKESQANMGSYATAHARVVFDSLYPVEKGFLHFRKLPKALMGRQGADEVLRTVTGIDPHQLHALRLSRDYFQELVSQYAFLRQQEGKSPCGQHQYALAANWSDVERILAADDHTIAVVVNVEGAHCFNTGLPGRKTSANPAEVLQNIGTVKQWRHAPFSINLAHHFYNELAGHSRSFKPGIYQAFNQKKGIGLGFTPLGEQVAHALLDDDNGRRVLIDIKHMSVRSRREYYDLLQKRRKARPAERIPILCSHTGMNEFETMRASRARKDKARKSKNSYFHNWAINLSAEEIRLIHDSGGLIGVMVDKGLLGSAETLAEIKGIADPVQRKDAFLRLVADTIFHAVRAVNQPSAWDMLALGSDYDGLISHIDLYPDAASLPQLRDDLRSFIERHNYGRELWHGLEPWQITDKIMRTNALRFLQTHF